MSNKSKFGLLLGLVVVVASACGESKPAASPEPAAAPMSEPGAPAEGADAGMDDEHAMPDAGTMKDMK